MVYSILNRFDAVCVANGRGMARFFLLWMKWLNKVDKDIAKSKSALCRALSSDVGIYGKSIKNVLLYNLSLRKNKRADIIRNRKFTILLEMGAGTNGLQVKSV